MKRATVVKRERSRWGKNNRESGKEEGEKEREAFYFRSCKLL